jgi:vitamin B12 transporter
MVASLFFCSKLHAQKDSSWVLNEVVITATKFPLKTSRTRKVITVITEKDLQQNSGSYLFFKKYKR